MTDPESTPSSASAHESPYADEYRFVGQVLRICEESPGARAALRSGLRKRVDDCERMHWVIAGLVPEAHRHYENTERAYYAIAAMIASASASKSHAGTAPEQTVRSRRNFGECLAGAVDAGLLRESSAEARLRLLTKQSVGGLHRTLPASVRIVGEQLQFGDWVRLLADLRAWDLDRPRVTRQWHQSFYRTRLRSEREAADRADATEHSEGAGE
ncbi:type I-E CRISPR-associated protein Cse2/CasB [Streptomyces sp. NPDC050085]|uniref:type I-E CRISPR-associated protein Cse2/CasB n=1 Tax=Streptomyces sp. NPDC050085 TaxID=3365600 RepID=UPI0037B8C467